MVYLDKQKTGTTFAYGGYKPDKSVSGVSAPVFSKLNVTHGIKVDRE